MCPKDEVYWYTLRPFAPPVRTRTLASDLEVPIAIIGGGIAGLMCAQRLREKNIDCIVLDRSFCGSGATGKSSGFITPDSELELTTLVKSKGPTEARRLWDFAKAGVSAIERTIQEYGLLCDYQVQDSLFVANSLKRAQTIQAEHKAHQELGYPSEYYSAEALPSILGSRAYYGAIRTSETFGMSGYLYCQGLKGVLEQRGVRIYEGVAARRIQAHRVETESHSIAADKVILCTDRYLPELGIVPLDVYHAQTFLAISKPLSDGDLRRLFPASPLMIWDTDLIYQYYRLIAGGRLLVGAASLLYTYALHEKHDARGIVRKIETYLTRVFPGMNVELEYLWPGLIGVSKDFLPLAGKHPHLEDVFFMGAAAGLPWASALGYYMADKLIDGRSDLDGHFAPDRPFPIGHGLETVLRRPVSFALCHGATKYFRS